MHLEPDVLNVLTRSSVQGNLLYLPEQLDRKMYLRVAKAIECVGGTWNRAAKAHVFIGPAMDALVQLRTGKVVDAQKELAFFETPDEVVQQMIETAHLEPRYTALEPSAGHGAIAVKVAAQVVALTAVDIDYANVEYLRTNCYLGRGGRVVEADFLTIDPSESLDKLGHQSFDRILMNPPFTKGADIKHILHAMQFLTRGTGRLVAICGANAIDKTTKASKKLAAIVVERGWRSALPDCTFHEAGTDVRTAMLTINAD